MELEIHIDQEGGPGHLCHFWDFEKELITLADTFITIEEAELAGRAFVANINAYGFDIKDMWENYQVERNTVYTLSSGEWGYYGMFVGNGPRSCEAMTKYHQTKESLDDFLYKLQLEPIILKQDIDVDTYYGEDEEVD